MDLLELNPFTMGPHLLVLLVLVVPLLGQLRHVRNPAEATYDVTSAEDSPGKEVALGCLAILYAYCASTAIMMYAAAPHLFAPLEFASPKRNAITAGVIVAVAGTAFSAWARITLARNWVGGFQLRRDHMLVQRGPYRWVRHPMYVGFALTVLGITLATMNALPIITEGVFRTMLLFRAIREERNLEAKFGDEFHAYRERTGMFFPKLRRRT